MVRSEHLHLLAMADDSRSADEHCSEGPVKPRRIREGVWALQGRLKAVNLRPEKVSVHLNVKPTDQSLAALLLPSCAVFGQENQACAGAPNRPPSLGKLLQLGEQPPLLSDQRHRRALAAGNNQPVHRGEFLLGAHLDGRRAVELVHHPDVLPEAALQGQHAHYNLRSGRRHVGCTRSTNGHKKFVDRRGRTGETIVADRN
mmetsp:Transcript_25337/g.45166  ORF Transcript_25337/g.45166 Transcript_25337/m.45166 type:complete len:201 (-) Transcript_25337:107-709(-)